MGKTDTRRRAKRRIDHLSDDSVNVADRFLAWLEDTQEEDATEELLRVPGLLDDVRKAEKDIAAGRTVAAEALKRKG